MPFYLLANPPFLTALKTVFWGKKPLFKAIFCLNTSYFFILFRLLRCSDNCKKMHFGLHFGAFNLAFSRS
nr:MAG TPA: hypothetical protein [Caudoviricetes sp.]